jgi:hypothetical protein
MEESVDEKPVANNAVKKEELLLSIAGAKWILPFYRRTPAPIREAEALLKKINGDLVYPEDQFKLYQCIAKAKPKTSLLKFLEQNIIVVLMADIPQPKSLSGQAIIP